MSQRSITPRRAVLFAAILATCLAGAGEAVAANARAGLSSPLRVGAQPGCRWVQGPAKTIRVCDAKKVCRAQTVPAQRIWACGTVRD